MSFDSRHELRDKSLPKPSSLPRDYVREATDIAGRRAAIAPTRRHLIELLKVVRLRDLAIESIRSRRPGSDDKFDPPR